MYSNNLEIKVVTDNNVKKQFMLKCDPSFEKPVCLSNEGKVLIDKICTYALFIGAYCGEEQVGYCAAYVNDNVTYQAYITMIAILPEYQHKGIGQKLMSICVKEAKSRNMKTIKLEVNKANNRAIRFYEKNGYNFIKEQHNEKSYYMSKII